VEPPKGNGLDADIAVISLAQPVKNIAPVTLLQLQPGQPGFPTVGTTITMVGYGTQGTGSEPDVAAACHENESTGSNMCLTKTPASELTVADHLRRVAMSSLGLYGVPFYMNGVIQPGEHIGIDRNRGANPRRKPWPAGREMLSHVAPDVALAPALRRFAAAYRDEDQAAMEILAVGAAVSMIILVATTSFEATFGGVRVSKIAASAEQVSAAASWVSRLTGGGAGRPHEGGDG
jgi:hypothetical protein